MVAGYRRVRDSVLTDTPGGRAGWLLVGVEPPACGIPSESDMAWTPPHLVGCSTRHTVCVLRCSDNAKRCGSPAADRRVAGRVVCGMRQRGHGPAAQPRPPRTRFGALRPRRLAVPGDRNK